MSSLLRYLSTARGADLVLVCNQEIFLVHTVVIAEFSPVLERGACTSKVLDGEVLSINDFSPPTLGKILAFMYKGDVSDSCRRTLAAAALTHLPPDQKFPASDKQLLPLWEAPVALPSNDENTLMTVAATDGDKWAKILQRQAAMAIPFDLVGCKDYEEVVSELDVYLAATKLEIPALQKSSMDKVLVWFKAELQAGRPTSADFRAAASNIIREHEDFGKSFVGICAKYLPVVEKDSALVSIIEEKHSFVWNIAISVRHQWSKEVDQHRMELEAYKDLLFDLEYSHGQQNTKSEDCTKVLTSQVETLSRSLALAEGREAATTRKIGQLENLTRTLQEELLAGKALVLQLKEANRALKGEKANKQNNATQELVTKIEDLERALASKEKALEQSRAANQVIKDDLRCENDGLRVQIEKLDDDKDGLRAENGLLKGTVNKIMRLVNDYQDCPRCKRWWDIRINHKKYTSICVGCKHCGYKEWHKNTH